MQVFCRTHRCVCAAAQPSKENNLCIHLALQSAPDLPYHPLHSHPTQQQTRLRKTHAHSVTESMCQMYNSVRARLSSPQRATVGQSGVRGRLCSPTLQKKRLLLPSKDVSIVGVRLRGLRPSRKSRTKEVSISRVPHEGRSKWEKKLKCGSGCGGVSILPTSTSGFNGCFGCSHTQAPIVA